MEKNCDDGEILWSWRNIVSSIVIEVIRVISNLFIFFTKKFYEHKSIKRIKSTKHQTPDNFHFYVKKNKKHEKYKNVKQANKNKKVSILCVF